MSDTKEYIINEAYGLFLNKSYEAVSISDISKAIGLTKGALYHHFKNKEDLFKAVIDKYLDIIEMSIPEKNVTIEELIDGIIKNMKKITSNIIGDVSDFVPLNYMSLIIDAFRHYPEFEKKKVHLFKVEVGKIKQVIDNAVKRGEIRKDINTSIIAANFFSLSISIAYQLLHDNSPKKAINYLREQLNELHRLIKI